MIKMRKINNKGFVLVETLVTAVFVMTIFSLLYVNFYPMLGEYEKREAYDDVDSKYGAYWFKRIIEQDRVDFNGNIINDINTNGYHQFSCNDITGTDDRTITDKALCNNLVNALNVGTMHNNPTIYITKYKLLSNGSSETYFKSLFVSDDHSNDFPPGFSDYVLYLPRYDKIQSLNGAEYRIILAYHHVRDEDVDYWSYSTIEVRK